MRAGDARNWARGRRATAAISSALTGVLLACAATATAAPVPGTPDPVAPGVPGYGRAWELVTPSGVTPARLIAGAGFANPAYALSPSGDRLAYETVNASSDASYGVIFATAMAERRADGWVSTPLDAPYPGLTTLFPTLFNEEGLLAFDPEVRTSIWGNKLPAPASGLGLFTRAADGTYAPLGRIGEAGKSRFLGASRDLRRILFVSSDHLLPADAARAAGQKSIYELFNSELHLVDVNDDGSLISTCGFESAPAFRFTADGQRVFFGSKPACGARERVYLRAGGHTTEISASQCTLPDPQCGPEKDVGVIGATPSGSVAYLVTEQRLTNDDTNELQDLYSYDVASGDLTLLTPRPPSSTFSPFSFNVRPSSDGSRVYITVGGQLTDEDTPGGNLYLADGQGLHFVASLSGSWRTQASTDDRYVIFETASQLAPEDTDESADIYRYDAVTDSYKEISTGLDGSGNGAFNASLEESGADISQRIFFATAEPLLSQDHNELEDVYEWTEAGGLGLVSAGTPGFGAEFLKSTADARTVLFRTQATLVPRDRDGGELDIYAARVGGGFPESAEPAGCGAGGACEVANPGTPHRTPPVAGAGGPFIGVAPIGAAARRQLVAKGSTTLLLEVSAAGRLTAQGKARVGGHGEIVATGAAVAKAAGPVRLRLRLTKVGRRSLTHGRDLRVKLTLRLPARRATERTDFLLEGTR
jgi:hypothetical protein